MQRRNGAMGQASCMQSNSSPRLHEVPTTRIAKEKKERKKTDDAAATAQRVGGARGGSADSCWSCSSLRVVVTQPTAASESRNFSSSPSRYGGLARSPEPTPGTGEEGKGGPVTASQSKLTFFFARHPVSGRRIGKLGDGRGHQKVPKNRGRTRENLHFDGLWRCPLAQSRNGLFCSISDRQGTGERPNSSPIDEKQVSQVPGPERHR
ncbi:hypothetical protein CCHR01_19016 [Colletotrichum chrysophilum]|uniref:Uncharacterized protein n=1 Tax=Colletotrichum chrysophilum TaxID=1836956 RepID=A0AAD9A1B7_9PEZI|nr:hypothetical protein CCHR01_19016 [Colletotrichum chrysophilum]